MMNEAELLRLIGRLPPNLIERTLPETEDISAESAGKEQITMFTNTETKRRGAFWLRGVIPAAIAGVLLAGNIALLAVLGKIGRSGTQALTPPAGASIGTSAETDSAPPESGTVWLTGEEAARRIEQLRSMEADYTGMTLQEAAVLIEKKGWEGWRIRCRYCMSDQPAETVLAQTVSYAPYTVSDGDAILSKAAAEYQLTVSGGPDCRTVQLTVQLPADAFGDGHPELIFLDENGFTVLAETAPEPETIAADGTFAAEIAGCGRKTVRVYMTNESDEKYLCGIYDVDFEAGTAVAESLGDGFTITVTE